MRDQCPTENARVALPVAVEPDREHRIGRRHVVPRRLLDLRFLGQPESKPQEPGIGIGECVAPTHCLERRTPAGPTGKVCQMCDYLPDPTDGRVTASRPDRPRGHSGFVRRSKRSEKFSASWSRGSMTVRSPDAQEYPGEHSRLEAWTRLARSADRRPGFMSRVQSSEPRIPGSANTRLPHLLGLYLGDGSIARYPRSHRRDPPRPGSSGHFRECRAAMAVVMPSARRTSSAGRH